MPSDALAVIQTNTSLSATASGSGFSANTPRWGTKVRVSVVSGSCASGSFTGQFSLDISYDGGSTWSATLFQAPAITFTTTATSQEQFIPYEVSETTPGTPAQVRLVYTKASGSGSGHGGSYTSQIVLARPS